MMSGAWGEHTPSRRGGTSRAVVGAARPLAIRGMMRDSSGMKIDDQADFGMRECPNCAVEVPANENRCPICGYEFPVRGPLQRRVLWIVVLLLILLLWPVLLSLR